MDWGRGGSGGLLLLLVAHRGEGAHELARAPRSASGRTWRPAPASCPCSLARSSSRLGQRGEAADLLRAHHLVGHRPALDDELVVAPSRRRGAPSRPPRGRRKCRRRAGRPSGRPASRTAFPGPRGARGCSSAREGRRRKRAPCARSCVIFSTGRPRYSASTTACALASRAETSATTSFLPSRFRLKVFLLLLFGASLSRAFGNARSAPHHP